MGEATSLLIWSIIIALIFDLINGFHDAANSIATIVSTRVLRPQFAVLWAAFFNFIAMFIFTPKVADTISKIIIIETNDPEFLVIIFCGLLGAIVWNLFSWWKGLPTSSSHALIGGLSGPAVLYSGWSVLRWDILIPTLEFIILAPIIGMIIGFLMMLGFYWLLRKQHPVKIDRFFKKGQLLSAALYSIGHGANDAQKTMGIMMALLLAGGAIAPNTELSLFNPQTSWIIISCQIAMAIGTAFGGWRIVKTMGQKITKLKPIGGFCAETAGSITLFFATYAGIPVSTTHTITGSIIGVGSASSKFSNVKWKVAESILWAWILTIPASAFTAAFIYYLWQF